MSLSDVTSQVGEFSDWLARHYTSEELAKKLLRLSGLHLSPRIEAHLANSLSAFGSVALARELARNTSSLDEFPEYLQEAEPRARAARRARGPSRYQLARVLRTSGAEQRVGVGA